MDTFHVENNVSFVKARCRPFEKGENKERNLAMNNLLGVRDKIQEHSKTPKFLLGPAI